MKRYTLTFEKFEAFLQKHQYRLDRIYSKKDESLFLQCRSPKHQHVFIVHVTDLYQMKIPSSGYEVLNVELSREDLPSHRSRFMLDVKGTLVDCDFATISSKNICLYTSSDDNMTVYLLTPDKNEHEPDVEEEEPMDELSRLEETTKTLLDSFNPRSEKLHENHPEVVLEAPKPVMEIDIQTKADNQDDTTIPELEHPPVQKEEEQTEYDSEEGEKMFIDNSVPPQLEESDIFFGLVYVVVGISEFYSDVIRFERKLTKIYEILDENELEMRKKRFDDLEMKLQDVGSSMRTRFNSLIEEEKDLRHQQVRLSVVMIQTNIIKEKINNNRLSQPLDKISQVETIYNGTQETIHELNMEILSLRDRVNEYISNCDASLNDLLSL